MSTRTTTVGSVVKATVKIVLPSGDQMSRATLSFGDGSKPIRLSRLSSHRRHTYTSPGHFTVTATVVDTRSNKTKATKTVTVLAPSGSYSGHYTVASSQGALSFFVSGNHAQVQDVASNVSVACSPGGQRVALDYVIDNVSLTSNGSVTKTATENSVYNGSPATLTFTFQGHVQGLTSTGAAAAQGSLTAAMSYNNGTAYTCTSGKLPWSVARDQQPTPQPTSLPPSGSYAGNYHVAGSQGALKFFVASDQTQLQDVASNVTVFCSPGGQRVALDYVIDNLSLTSTGSFATTATENSVYNGSPATLTFGFQGHVHGVNAQGVPRAAGSLVAAMSYNDGTAYACTSDKLPWSVTRDSQPTPQPTSSPPAGSYSGIYHVTGAQSKLTFAVSSDQTQLQDVSANVTVFCSPGGQRVALNLTIDSLALPSNGAFTATATQNDSYKGSPATDTFVFQGHFHGVNAQGVPRAAGSLTGGMTYNDGTAHTCLSDKLPWDATKS
jgi:urease beta subunit